MLFVIRKQERLSPSDVIPLAYYYIINGVVRQAPDLSTLISSRLHSITAGLNRTIQALAPCAKFHSSDGSYSWDDPKALTTSDTGAKAGGKRAAVDDNVATNPYQVSRTDFLLNEWAARFPMPSFSLNSVSTIPTPQQTSNSGGSAASNQPVSSCLKTTKMLYRLTKQMCTFLGLSGCNSRQTATLDVKEIHFGYLNIFLVYMPSSFSSISLD